MRLRGTWAPAAMAASVLALYAPALRYDFVYDDHWTITKNAGLAAPLSRVLHALLFGQGARLGLADKTRPAMVLSMWIDRRIFGLSPTAFHAHSVVLYVVVALLAWLALRVLLARPRAALFGAMFFAAAPLHAEVVACVSYREDLLVAVGAFAVVSLFFAPRPPHAPRPRWFEVAAMVSFMVLALGAKESGFAVPPLIVAIAWTRKDDLEFFRRRNSHVLAIVMTTLIFLNWRFSVPDDVPRAHDPGFIGRFLATARYEVRVTLDAFAPFFWSPERARPDPASPLWLVALAGLVVLMVWLRRSPRRRPFAMALALALIAPLASCPLVLPANELADRYLFLGVLGGAVAFGVFVDRALERHGISTRRAGAVFAAVVLSSEVAFASQARSAYSSDTALWEAAVARAPDSPRAWTGLSRVRRGQGRLGEADDSDARALALDPGYSPAKLTRVYNLLARGDVLEARAELSAFDVDEDLAGLRHARECALLVPAMAQACIAR